MDQSVEPSLKLRPKPSYKVHSYGCKVNTYDTGLLQKRLKGAGFELENQNPEVHILNTCAVTDEASKEAVRQIRRLKSQNPSCTVVVTGCAAQVDTGKFDQLDGADLVVANSHKGDLETLIKKHLEGALEGKVFKSNIFKKSDLEPGGGREEGHTRSFLKIQDGCNSFCTFCIIPFARGKSRSLSVDEIVGRMNGLSDEGLKEIVLTGVHIGDYEDGHKTLENLVEAVLEKTEVPRIRLSSLEPIELNERLLGLFSNDRLCPHFHMSIQSANSRVLQAMKRNYGQPEVRDSLLRIGEAIPNAFVGMDVIAGFPGETDEEFQDTYDSLAELPWTRIHVFPYSPRPGTFAMRLDGHMHRSKIMERAARLRELSHERYAKEALKQVNTVQKTMVLKKPSELGNHGVSRNYWPLIFDGQGAQSGDEINVRITGYDHSDWSKGEGALRGVRV